MLTDDARARLRLPTSLLGGVRGFLLVFVLLSSGPGMLPAIALAANEPLGLRLAAGVSILALEAWYVLGYRRQRLPTPGLLFEAPLLALIGIASGGPQSALPILFPWLMFRVFHSSVQGYVGAVGAAALAYVVTGVVWPGLHGLEPSDAPGLVGNLMAMPLMGSLMYVFSLTLVRLQERTVQAERLVQDLQVEIAERRRAEEALARSQERYRQVLETTHEAVWLSDASHRTTLVNAQMARLLGCPAVDILGRSLDTFLAAEDAASLVAGEGGVRRDVRIRRADGSLAWAILSSSPLVGDDGESLGSVGMLTDITERKQVEEALRILDRAVAATSVGIAISDARQRGWPVVYVNPAFERLTGYTAAEFLGRQLKELTGPDTPEHEIAAVTEAIKEQREATWSVATYRKDGTSFWSEVIVAPVRGEDGQATHFVWLLNDASARKEAEQQAETIARTEKLRALGQMATGIAHDLNHSLMLIASYSDLARRALDEDELDVHDLREMFGIVSRAALDGGETVKRLLLFTRAPAEGAQQPVDLNALAREVAQLTAPRWRDASQAEGRPISLIVKAAGQPVIMGAPARLREVLTNLIFNAVDALPRGGTIQIEVREGNGQALLEVSDDGVGMPPEVRARVFEPFFSTKGEAGSGLGLAMAFGVVEGHGGQIEVHSAAGRGTRVQLSFPLPELPRVVAAPMPVEAETDKRRLKILAVDDEPAIGQSVRRALRPDGHVVVVATSGEEAVEALAAEPFDLLLSDIGMGAGMNGWELASLARRGWPNLPIVLATGWGAAIDPDDARAKGIDAVLAKPYLPEDLRQVINACSQPAA